MKLFNHISNLYKNRRELLILEWTYLLIAIFSLFAAGLLALINQSLGAAVLIVPLCAFIAFAMNVVAWALIKLVIEAINPSLKLIEPEKKSVKPTKKA